MTGRRPVILDLFCGAGGMSLGFYMAGYSVGLALDSDPLAIETYSYNFGERCVRCDIKDISDIKFFAQEHSIDMPDVVIGGPPCQGFSRVGRGKLRQVNADPHFLHDPRNSLYTYFFRFVEELRPAFFVLENVPDMQYYEDEQGQIIDKIERRCRELDYTFDYRVLSAADYGVPQTRRRLFIVGNRLGTITPWPKASHRPDDYVTVWQAIGDLPIVDINHREDELPYTPRCELNAYQRLMRRGCKDVVYNHQTRWHNLDDIRAFRLLGEGGRYVELPDDLRRYDSKKLPEMRNEYFTDRYRKLKRDSPAWTLEAHIGKDTYRFIYPSVPEGPEPARTISVREAARLQSFPDWFRFRGAFTRQFFQVGNAVPPLLAEAVASAILPWLPSPESG